MKIKNKNKNFGLCVLTFFWNNRKEARKIGARSIIERLKRWVER